MMSGIEEGLRVSDVARFWEDGFLVIDNVLPTAHVERLRSACEAPLLLEEAARAGQEQRTVHLLELTAKHSAFLELARHTAIVELLRPLLGPDIQLQHSKLAAQARTSGTGGFTWHQDYPFFPHTNTDLVAVMVMLDDATPENGCMSMVRGSHKLGPLDHQKDGSFTGACQVSSLWEDHPENVVPITPRVGGISLHHCLTLHGSGPNLSGRSRRGIVFQYRAADAFQLADSVFTDTGLVVSGRRLDQVRCAMGTVHLPRRTGARPFGSAWNQEGALARQLNSAEQAEDW